MPRFSTKYARAHIQGARVYGQSRMAEDGGAFYTARHKPPVPADVARKRAVEFREKLARLRAKLGVE
jgi:hypothetical protein